MATSRSPPPPVPPRKSHIWKDIPYYHSSLQSLDDVKIAMYSYIEIEGSFLLRKSFSKAGVYTFTVVHNESLKHFSLNYDGEKYWLIHQKKFNSIDDLVKNYAAEDVPNLENVSGVRLKLPIPDVSRNLFGRRHSESENTNSNKNLDKLQNYSTSFDSSYIREIQDGLPANGYNYTQFKNQVQSTKSDSTQSLEVVSPISLRPPQETPRDVAEVGAGYTRVRDTQIDRLETLISQLRIEEEQTLHSVCDCGIYCRDAQLPGGWTVHISRQPGSMNRLFFVGPNQESSWDLPMDIVLELSHPQQEVLRALRSGRYQSLYNRSAPAEESTASGQRFVEGWLGT